MDFDGPGAKKTVTKDDNVTNIHDLELAYRLDIDWMCSSTWDSRHLNRPQACPTWNIEHEKHDSCRRNINYPEKGETLTGSYYTDLLRRFKAELRKIRLPSTITMHQLTPPSLPRSTKCCFIPRNLLKFVNEVIIGTTQSYFADLNKTYFQKG